MSDLETRVRRLERWNRALMIVLLLGAGAATLGAQRGEEALSATSLSLVDSQGKLAAFLNGGDGGGATIGIRSPDGKSHDVFISRAGVKTGRFEVSTDDKDKRAVWIDKDGIMAPKFSVQASVPGKLLAVFGRLSDELGGGGLLVIADDKNGADVTISRQGIEASEYVVCDENGKEVKRLGR